MDISIIILNYKSASLTLSCLKSIGEANFRDLKFEIIVVDNNSGDSLDKILAKEYPAVKFVQNKKNSGMGAGNNLGLKMSAGKYVVIMNPDTVAFPETFTEMYDFMEANPRVGMVGPRQYYPDMTVQDSCFRFPGLLTPIYRRTPIGRFGFARRDIDRYLMKDFDHSVIKEVDWLLGSFLFSRLEALKEVGVFDERFFMYFEDADLCRRFWEKGWRVVYNPESEIIHNHKRESAETPWYKFLWSRTSREHIISWIKYLKKWKKS